MGIDVVTLALAKKYTKESLEGAGALKGEDGKSAYQLAVENGFKGSEKEWLSSLTPHIGENGNWFAGEKDTGISATKISSTQDSQEIIFDENNKTISSVINGVPTVIANYSNITPIKESSINKLFQEE